MASSDSRDGASPGARTIPAMPHIPGGPRPSEERQHVLVQRVTGEAGLAPGFPLLHPQLDPAPAHPSRAARGVPDHEGEVGHVVGDDRPRTYERVPPDGRAADDRRIRPDRCATANERTLVLVLARHVAAWIQHIREHHRRAAEDVIFEYIITTPGYPRRVEGRKAVAELYRPYGTMIVLDRCHDLAVHHDIKTGVVVLEYASEGRVVSTGAPYTNRYISVLTITDRKVTHWRDYLDPVAVFDALGWPSR